MPTSARPYSSDAALLEKILVPSRSAPTLGPLYASGGRPLDLDTVLKRVAHSLPEIDAAVHQPDVLLSQLLSLDLRGRADALDERPSLRRPVFLRYVRDIALCALPQKPDLTEALAFVAIQQAEACSDVEEARRQLLAAYCLLAAVRRLGRLPAEADSLLSRAAFLLSAVDDQALFLRTLALLRWDQGRPEEAHLLLTRAIQLAKGKRPARTETALCQLVLGLLHLLEGVAVDRLLARLRAACAALDAAHQTFPSLLARLSLAYASALVGDIDTASSESRGAQELFSLLRDDSAAAYAGWLNARVSAILAPEGALEGLLLARKELLDRELPLAATLATIDAVHYLAASEQHALIDPFLADAPLPLDLPPATYLCQDLADPPLGSASRRAKHQAFLRREHLRLPSILRRVCLLRGIRTEPLPFV